MRAYARFVLGLALAVFVHAAGARWVPWFSAAVDVFLIATVVVARRGRPDSALLAGLACGWAADTLSARPFGLHGFADAAVGYGAALLARELVIDRRSSLAALFAAAALLQEAILALLGRLFLADPAPPPFASWAARIVSTALVGVAWIQISALVAKGARRSSSRASGGAHLPPAQLQ